MLAVTVFDKVLAPSTCQYLHTASSIGELGDEMHTAFNRVGSKPATALEHCLDSILRELGDESPCVEYWWRDKWVHVEAHEDVDEELFARKGVRSYPTNGHVLYLEVGDAVRGPTCVWERDEDAPVRCDFGALTTVPAVEGRLLRFSGELMHAVPKPPMTWFGSSLGEAAPAVPKARTKGDTVRSVVLFNTWPEPPLDVARANARDPKAVIEQMAAEFNSPKLDAMVKVMESPDFLCQARERWTQVEVNHHHHHQQQQQQQEEEEEPHNAVASTQLNVALLGEEERRQQSELTVQLQAPAGVPTALLEETAVTRFSTMPQA